MKRLAALTALALFGTLAVQGVQVTAAQDLENGKRQYNKCKACHDVGDTARNKVGPILNDILGRKAATYEGFNYSDDIKALAAKGLVWNEENLHKYMNDPKSVVPGGKMVFPGLKDKADRDDVIAYLKQFSKK